jgi:hypothetical protein
MLQIREPMKNRITTVDDADDALEEICQLAARTREKTIYDYSKEALAEMVDVGEEIRHLAEKALAEMLDIERERGLTDAEADYLNRFRAMVRICTPEAMELIGALCGDQFEEIASVERGMAAVFAPAISDQKQ